MGGLILHVSFTVPSAQALHHIVTAKGGFKNLRRSLKILLCLDRLRRLFRPPQLQTALHMDHTSSSRGFSSIL
ncbi:hypothetical protein KC19_VG161700 [Ceratodon purpureus]|uniref:Uncharacterized protein n=1 Tax=Ceratodon purpureus TaxID=3225 RepID=A0A8T0HR46_CERPU|nr:hypothetical protein KC19_VG161700 [Ceratodon purpureus]